MRKVPASAIATPVSNIVHGKASANPLQLLAQQQANYAVPVAQRLSIQDHQWEEATYVSNLSKEAYEFGNKKEKVVIKAYPSGSTVDYDPGNAESMLTETVGAKMGEVAAFGVQTAGTLLIETNSNEGRRIMAQLNKIGGLGKDLAAKIKDSQGFLVMEYMQAKPGSKLDALKPVPNLAEYASIFTKLGRLWTFDVILDNTDRFFVTNLDNLMIGPNGDVYGIDQNIFMGSTDVGRGGLGSEKAMSRLGKVIDPDRRKLYSTEMWDNFKTGVPLHLKDYFCIHFEAGVLQGIVDASGVQPETLGGKLAELPGFAQHALEAMGIGGMIDVLGVFRDSLDIVKPQLEMVNSAKHNILHHVSGGLSLLANERKMILSHFWDNVCELEKQHGIVSRWLTGKSQYWKDHGPQILELAFFHQNEYQMATQTALVIANDAPHESLLLGQTAAWADAMDAIRRKIESITKEKETANIGLIIQQLKSDIAQELRVDLL